MSKNILITGGTGLVGTALTHQLISKGFTVSYLSRKSGKIGDIKLYEWNPSIGKIDEEALANADAVIHLAGANVGEGRWTKERKKEILESRTLSTRLLVDKLNQNPGKVKTLAVATGVGIYGDTKRELRFEDSPAGDDFLAKVCVAWEQEANRLEQSTVKKVIIRIGVVLSNQGGALPKIAQPIRYWVGAAFGDGAQFMSWIHIDDLCAIFVKAIEDENFNGVFNAVSPHPVTNHEFTKYLARTLGKPLILPNVPEFVLKLLLGEQSFIVLTGNRVSGEKVINLGFKFKYNTLDSAFENLLLN